VKYAIRIPAKESLDRDIAELLTRRVRRPPHKPVVWYKGFLYQAARWNTARRQGTVPAVGLYHHEPQPAEPGGGAPL
jgi:hypothetical protein